jgi:hypothetical protein
MCRKNHSLIKYLFKKQSNLVVKVKRFLIKAVQKNDLNMVQYLLEKHINKDVQETMVFVKKTNCFDECYEERIFEII